MKKNRLTITLPEDLLERVDSLVDKKTIRNRSHAIESLVRESLTPSLNTAVFLAGGKYTSQANPLLNKIKNKTVFELMIEHLVSFGITKIIVSQNKEDNSIENQFANGEQLGVEITYSKEKKAMGTAGALKQAQNLIPAHNPFLVIHGDVVTTLSISDFFEFHLAEGSLASIAVKPRMGQKQYGQIFMQGNKIIQFNEKAESGITIINTGLYILDYEVLNYIKPEKYQKLETDIFPVLSQKEELSAFIFQGLWYDISSEENLLEAQDRWKL